MSSIATEPVDRFPRTLVLGATGRLGRMLRTFWSDRDVIWQARDRREGHVTFDVLGDPDALAAACRDASAILCLAGIVPGKGPLDQNADIARAVVEASGATTKIPVLTASSAAVYGRRDIPCRETDPATPDSPYGIAKRDMEVLATARGAELGVPVCNLRIANIAGADAILGGWTPGFSLDAYPDGTTPRRSYAGPQGFSQMIASLVRRAGELPSVLNVALPGSVEMGALLSAAGLAWTPRTPGANVIRRVELDVAHLSQFHHMPARASDAQSIVADWRAWRDSAGAAA